APPPPPFIQMNGPFAGPAHPYEPSFAQSDTSYAAGPAEVAEILEAKKMAKGKAIERYYE
ncbi:3822_t:CDS:1, partial [Acaulospora colombiana]